MSNMPINGAVCYEDSIIILRKNKEINALLRELETARAEIEWLKIDRQEQIDIALWNPFVCCNGVQHKKSAYVKGARCLYCDLAAAVELLLENNENISAVSTRLKIIGNSEKLHRILEKCHERVRALLARLEVKR